MILIKDKHKKFNHYGIKEIKTGDVIQLMFNRNITRWNYATHIRVLRIDPTGSGKIIGQGICSQKGEEYLLHVEFVYRNYSLDPIIPGTDDYKKKRFGNFSRKPLI